MKKRGRPPKHTPEQLIQIREGVNHLYWGTSCSIAQICRHYGISNITVNKLLVSKEKYFS
jgi:hypothetical protein